MKEITYEEFEKLITPLIDYHNQMAVVDDSLSAIFPESRPFTELGLNVEKAYLELINKYLDNLYCDEWISYFIYDCAMGKNPMEVSYKNSKEKKVKYSMKDIKTLYKVIYSK